MTEMRVSHSTGAEMKRFSTLAMILTVTFAFAVTTFTSYSAQAKTHKQHDTEKR
jgi:hypothetical protein